jgi:hypothetical protein
MPGNNEVIISTLKTISRLARTGNYADAASSLNRCLVMIDKPLTAGAKTADTGIKKIMYSLQTLLSMLEQQDWIAIADIIDYELVPLWEQVFP